VTTTPSGPVLPIPTSATGVTVVTTCGLVSLAGFAVGVLAVMLAVLVRLTAATGAVTVTVTLLLALGATVPIVQFTVPEVLTPPPPAFTNDVPAGKVSLATTLLAVPGPALVMVMV